MIRTLLTWPARKDNDLCPWWQMIWNLCWLPTIVLGKYLFLASVFMVRGWREATAYEERMHP